MNTMNTSYRKNATKINVMCLKAVILIIDNAKMDNEIDIIS